MKGAAQPIKHPRRLGEVGRAVVDTLQAHGISGARFYKRKHARVEFELGGQTQVFTFPCTPKAPQRAARTASRELEKQIGAAMAGSL